MDINMKKAVIEMKEKYNISITKETFESFTSVKPHIDMLVSKIVMGSPVLSSNVELADNYSANNPDYKKTLDFLKTFQLDIDGYDDFIATKLVRYSRFMMHLTIVLDSKFYYSMSDMIQPNPRRMAYFILLLSEYACLVTTLSDYIKETIEAVGKEKIEQAAFLEMCANKENELLNNIDSYETLITIQDKYLYDYEKVMETNAKLQLELENIRSEILREESRGDNLKRDLESEKLKLREHNVELSALRKKFVESPDKIGVELKEINLEIDKENAKLSQYFASCSQLTCMLNKAQLMKSSQKLFCENVASVRATSDNIRNIDLELAHLRCSENQRIDALVNDKEKCLKDIDNILFKTDKIKKKLDLNKETSKDYDRKIDDAKKRIEIKRRKIDNVKNDGVIIQIAECRQERVKIGVAYKTGLANLKNNFKRSFEELIELYKKL